MTFEIIYHADVVKSDIPNIGNADAKRIKKAIEEKLTSEPELFGQPLRKSLKGYRKLRVGDYRVLYVVDDQNQACLRLQCCS